MAARPIRASCFLLSFFSGESSEPLARDSIGFLTVVDPPYKREHLLGDTHVCQVDRIKANSPPRFPFEVPRHIDHAPSRCPRDSPFPLAFLSARSLARGHFHPSPDEPCTISRLLLFLSTPSRLLEILPRLPFRYRPPREACSESRKRSITFYARIVSHVAPWSLILTTRNWVA